MYICVHVYVYRSIHFKPENIVVAGIIPGPKEPNQATTNSYLRPLVKELNMLFTEGMMVEIRSEIKRFLLHSVLVCVICEQQQSLEVFLSHSSYHGCLKCSKYFPRREEVNRNDFSGVETGFPREHESHKSNAKFTLECNTPTDL